MGSYENESRSLYSDTTPLLKEDMSYVVFGNPTFTSPLYLGSLMNDGVNIRLTPYFSLKINELKISLNHNSLNINNFRWG
jgi:hypothetical protein